MTVRTAPVLLLLVAGPAAADPCAQELVLGRGPLSPGADRVREASVRVDVTLARELHDDLPMLVVSKLDVTWTWQGGSGWVLHGADGVRPDVVAPGTVETGGQLPATPTTRQCEAPPVAWTLTSPTEQHVVRWHQTAITACRLRVPLDVPLADGEALRVEVHTHGVVPPLPITPSLPDGTSVDGAAWLVRSAGDLVLDVPGCS